MSNSIFWRLLWKEYRTQRALWIAMLLLAAMLQFITLVAWMVLGDANRTSVQLFGLALGLSAFYALGCGATLFAAEHEAGTYEFQRMLPVTALRLFFCKLLLAIVSTAALVGLLWLLASALAGWRWPDAATHVGLWALWGFGAIELLVWAVFFSLLSRRPLRAAILAVTAASVSVHFVFAWLNIGHTYSVQTYLNPVALPYRAAIVGFVVLLDVWLGRRWFHGSLGAVGRAARGIRTAAVVDRPLDVSVAAAPQRTMVLGRLLWQQSRQSIGMMGTLAALAVPLGLVGAWVWHTAPFDRNRYTVVVLLTAAMASLMGSCVFLADQGRGRFRALAEWGVPPGYVWLSRQIVWMVPVLLLTVAVLPLFLLHDLYDLDHLFRAYDYHYLYVSHFSILLGDAREVGFFLGSVALAYASGQLCSMLLRSGLLAAIFGLILTSLLCGWVGLMWWWEVPWFWSVAPIPLVLLLATWLRTPNWLLERNRPGAWLWPGLVLVVPVAVLLAAVPIYRLEQIPLVDPGFSPEQYARPITAEEQETLDMYRRAMELHVPMQRDPRPPEENDEPTPPEPTTEPDLTERQIAWIEANEETIALAVEASRREHGDFFNPTRERPAWWRYDSLLPHLLVLSGRRLQSEGKLDEALERYMAALRFSVHLRRRTEWPGAADHMEEMVYNRLSSWAAHPQQTPERIRGVIGQLDELDARRPSRTDAIKSRHMWILRVISADPETLAAADLSRREMMKAMLWARWLPWEQARARRLLNRQTADDLKILSKAETEASQGVDVGRPSRWYPYDFDWEPCYALRQHFSLPNVQYYRGDIADMVEDFVQIETRRRAVRLQLLLVAWKLEHGALPETLDQLVGPYLKRIPTDPCSGEPFRYFPEGLPIPVQWGGRAFGSPTRQIEADTPFVWSAGSNVYRADSDSEKAHERYCIIVHGYGYGRSSSHRARSEYEIWQWGWLYPVP